MAGPQNGSGATLTQRQLGIAMKRGKKEVEHNKKGYLLVGVERQENGDKRHHYYQFGYEGVEKKYIVIGSYVILDEEFPNARGRGKSPSYFRDIFKFHRTNVRGLKKEKTRKKLKLRSGNKKNRQDAIDRPKF